MLALDGLTCKFSTNVAVRSVSLEFEQGTFVGIIGRSGAGKSTLLRSINRLVEPSEGRILFDGTDVTALHGQALRLWRAQAAMIFQQFNLVPRLDVLTNVLLGCISQHTTVPSLFKRFSETARAQAVETLDRLDLLGSAFQRAETLSGGQQQRVAIARALMQEPSILLADEPIASLDPRNAERVMSSLKTINREDGITVLCNLHTIDAAREYSDRIIGLAKGRVVFDGSSADLTPVAMREIYQIDGSDTDVPEAITSTTGWLKPQPVIEAA